MKGQFLFSRAQDIHFMDKIKMDVISSKYQSRKFTDIYLAWVG